MGFSAEWLSLREPADRAARDEALARQAAIAAGPIPLVVDFGCGTGATWRALAPCLPSEARWRFIDNDPALLAEAGRVAGGNADLVEADLGQMDTLPLDGASLVTASALLDLMPEAWVADLAGRLVVPFYATLNYDGRMSWDPEHQDDSAVTAAFNQHQVGDKGIGLALGPHSAKRTIALFEAAGFTVLSAESTWLLGPDMAPLQRELTDGIAQAAAEAGAQDSAASWGRHRHASAGRTQCRIGHIDILALPPGNLQESTHVLR